MRALCAIFAALLVLTVVVCPITPTPIAVVSVHSPAPHTAPAAIFSAIPMVAPRLDLSLWAVLPAAIAVAVSHDVLSQTCVRLC